MAEVTIENIYFGENYTLLKRTTDITGQIKFIVAISLRPRWWNYEIMSYSDKVLLHKRCQI